MYIDYLLRNELQEFTVDSECDNVKNIMCAFFAEYIFAEEGEKHEFYL